VRAPIAVILLLASACSSSGPPRKPQLHPSCPPGAALEWQDPPGVSAECMSSPKTHHGFAVSYSDNFGYIIDCYPEPTPARFLISVDTLTRRLQGTRDAVEPQVDRRRCADQPLRPLWDELVARATSRP
jgi:hypothetical protein